VRLEDVVKKLNISPLYISAIESEKTNELPQNQSYALGFIRTYAQMLGLDGTKLAKQFKDQNFGEETLYEIAANENTEHTEDSSEPSRGFLFGSLLVTSLIIAGGYMSDGLHLQSLVSKITEIL
jgi:cytoskeleton protein RodZ